MNRPLEALRWIAKSVASTMNEREGTMGEVMSAHEHWQMDASAPELYERYLVPAITSVWADDLLDRVEPGLGESILDIACGTGVVARLAEQRGHAGRLV